MSSAVLQFDEVVVDYPRKGRPPLRAVAGVSLEVQRGQVHALVGETGCGKSTVGRAACGLVPVSSGGVYFEGEPVAPVDHRTRPSPLRRLQLIFQDPGASLNPRRTIGKQIDDALKLAADAPSGPVRAARVRELLDTVGLPRAAEQCFPREFSGGQRQRVCIARALATRPAAIVADEPIAALDASAQAQIANLFVELARELDIALLFISHDLGIVRHIADVVTVMYLGKVAEVAPTDALWAAPQHPYTAALFAAEPEREAVRRLPEALSGEVPDPASPPPGCRFHPRCPVACDRGLLDEPVLVKLGEARWAACWRTIPGAT